jgi:hypothetical protein
VSEDVTCAQEEGWQWVAGWQGQSDADWVRRESQCGGFELQGI